MVLNIDNLELARTSYQNIFKNVKNTVPNAKIDGIMISPMKKGDLECILGAKIDPVFGPIVMFWPWWNLCRSNERYCFCRSTCE